MTLLLVAAAQVLQVLLSVRTMTNLGAVSVAPVWVNKITGGVGWVSAVTALVAVLLPRSSPRGLVRWAVPALYTFLMAGVAGGVLISERSVDLKPLVLALVIHALAVGVAADPAVMIDRLRWMARLVTTMSLASAIVAPSWAFMTVYSRVLGIERLAGLAPHPNSLSIIAGVALALEFLPPRGRLRVLFASIAILTVLLTQSATGCVAVATVVAVVLVRFLVRRGSSRLAILAAALFTLIGLLLVAVLAGGRLDTVSGRTGIWDYAWQSFLAHPFVGSGGYFLSEADRTAHLPPSMFQASNAHGQVMQVLGEAGVVGSAALLVLFLVVAAGAWRGRLLDGGGRLILLAVLVINSTTEVVFRALGVPMLVAVLAAPVLIAVAKPIDEVETRAT